MNAFDNRKITSTFEVINLDGEVIDSGFLDESGVSFRNVLEAAAWLTNEGASYSSSSEPVLNTWFYFESWDHKTGELTKTNYHPKGFSQDEIESLSFAVESGLFIETPSELTHTSVEEWEAFAKANVDLEKPSLIAKYLDRFAEDNLFKEKSEFKASMPKDFEVEIADLFPGCAFCQLTDIDAVYFGVTRNPVLKTQIDDGKLRYDLISVTDFLAQARTRSDENNDTPSHTI